eukprot:5161105-Alexandrium_andersonii.AAC.1
MPIPEACLTSAGTFPPQESTADINVCVQPECELPARRGCWNDIGGTDAGRRVHRKSVRHRC